jgi:hypothetical protein
MARFLSPGFNPGGKRAVRRAMDITEGAKINERAFKALIKAAVKENAKGRK